MLQVIDVDGGVILDDIIPPLTAFAFVSWLDDSRSFVYHRYDDPAAGAPPQQRRLDSRSYRHAWAPTRGRTWWCWHEGSTRGSR